jgi:hypothetical protein
MVCLTFVFAFSILTPVEMMASPAVANTVANIFLQVGKLWGMG